MASTAADLYADTLVWDQHGCLRLSPDTRVDDLARYANAGVDFASINVGFDAIPWTQSMQVLASFRHQVLAQPDRYVLVDHADDVLEAKAGGRLAVSFDLEGTVALDGRLELVEAYHALGVRTMLMAYNLANLAAGGCHDETDSGLTAFGRDVVAEMNRVGMLVDATHCSYRTTMDLFESSRAPVIFSHSVPSAVKAHDRNISDEQMRGCAATGGVVAINGIGLFLGDNDGSTEALLRAIDHAVSVVGPEHVGIGLDYVFDRTELDEYLAANPDIFPPEDGYASGIEMVAPEQLPQLAELLLSAGHTEADVGGILGANLLRVAQTVWT